MKPYSAWTMAALTFALLFGPKLGGTLIDLSVMAAAVILVFSNRGRIPVPRPRVLWMWTSVTAIYSMVLTATAVAGDVEVALRPTRALLILMAIFSLSKRAGEAPAAMTKAAVVSIGIHGYLILGMASSAPLRRAVYAFAGTTSIVNQNAPFELGLRVPGLTYGLSTTSLLQAFGVLLAADLFIRRELGRTASLILLTGSAAGLMLTGRSGLLVLAAAFVMAALKLVQTTLHASAKSARLRPVIAGILLIFIVPASSSIALALFPDTIGKYISERYGETTDELQTHPLQILQRELDAASRLGLPSSTLHAVFGDASLGRSEQSYVDTDSGFVRTIYQVGVLGLAFHILSHLAPLWIMIRRYSIRLISILVWVTALLYNLKEVAFFSRNLWVLQCVVLVEGLRRQNRSRHLHPEQVSKVDHIRDATEVPV